MILEVLKFVSSYNNIIPSPATCRYDPEEITILVLICPVTNNKK